MSAVAGVHRFLVVLLLSVASTMEAQSAQELFQQALVAERSAGKLSEAIALYQRVVTDAGRNRGLAARALVRLGAAFESQGRSEARAAYGRVVRDFSDQPDQVSLARTRLAALDQATPRGPTGRVSVAREVWADANVTSLLTSPSADGRLLAFTDWPSGQLAVRDLESGETRRLTKSDKPGTSQLVERSVISQDGRRIAYSWFTGAGTYELRTIDLQGGEPQTIPLPAQLLVQPFAWTPSGDAILATLIYRDGDRVLALIRPTGHVVPLVTINWRWIGQANISPDGRWVVFDYAEGESPQRDIQIIAVDGTSRGVLVRHAANDWHPMWTPDGKSVAFLSDRTGLSVLWIVDVTSGTAQSAPHVLKADIGDNVPIGFTRDGALLSRNTGPAKSDLVVADIDIDSLLIRRKSEPVAHSFVGRNSMPDWSPDGKSLVFVSRRGSGTTLPGEDLLVTLDLETNQEREFKVPLSYITWPRWSADRRHVFLSGQDRDQRPATIMSAGSGAQFRYDLETGFLERLTPDRPEGGIRGTMSADERSILYVHYDSTRAGALRRLTVASGDEETLYTAPEGSGIINGRDHSPDNRWIVIRVVENRGTPQARVSVKLLALEDGRVIRDLNAPQGFYPFNWSPDSRYLIGITGLTSFKGATFWRVPVDGTPSQRFAFDSLQYVNHYRLSPDGKRIVFLTMDSNGAPSPALWTFENLVPAAVSSNGTRRR